MRVDLDRGTVVSLCSSNGMRGAAWGDDGTIVFSPDVQTGLWTVPATGGPPVSFTKCDRV